MKRGCLIVALAAPAALAARSVDSGRGRIGGGGVAARHGGRRRTRRSRRRSAPAAGRRRAAATASPKGALRDQRQGPGRGRVRRGGNKLQRFDCSAMEKVCVLDSTRGATCVTLPPPATPRRGSRDMAHATPPVDMAHANPPPPRGHGDANAAAAARHGDDAAGAARHGDRAADVRLGRRLPRLLRERDRHRRVRHRDLVRSVDGPDHRRQLRRARARPARSTAAPTAPTAATAPVSVDMAMPPAMNAECDALGYAGACEDGHARWCSGGQVFDIDCGDARADLRRRPARRAPTAATRRRRRTRRDASRASAIGWAWPASAPTGVARWCSGGQIIEVDCGAQGADAARSIRARRARTAARAERSPAARRRSSARDGDGGARVAKI